MQHIKHGTNLPVVVTFFCYKVIEKELWFILKIIHSCNATFISSSQVRYGYSIDSVQPLPR